MIRACSLVLLLVLSWPAGAQGCDSSVAIEGSRLTFDGCLSDEAVDKAISVIDRGISAVIVRSHGGGVGAAMRLARAIANRNLPVRVRGYCDSSCANYVLPVGMPSTLESGARILFHGDAATTFDAVDKSSLGTETLAGMRDLVEQERRFYADYPRAARAADWQRVVRLQGPVLLETMRLRCEGLGKPGWVPRPPVLIDLQLVDVVESSGSASSGGDPGVLDDSLVYVGSPLWRCQSRE